MQAVFLKTIQTIGIPVVRQGTYNQTEEFPAVFFTFWHNGSYSQSKYNNTRAQFVHEYDLNVYAKKSIEAFTKLELAIVKLKEVGFLIDGCGYDVPSDHAEYIGRGVVVRFLENGGEINDK